MEKFLQDAGDRVGLKPKKGRPAFKEYQKKSEPKWLREADEPLEKLTVVELQDMCRKHNIKGFSTLNKAALIRLIKREKKEIKKELKVYTKLHY